MWVPLEPARAHLVISKSRFIASLYPVHSESEVRTVLAKIRTELPGASHHPYAYVLGGAIHQEHSSDDGEPGGTAGRPILQALKSREVEDAVLIVTRYFGGIKLGTAGLARAYREAALQVLEIASLGQKVRVTILSLGIPYSWYEYVEKQLPHFNAHLLTREFTTEVHLTLAIPHDTITSFLTFIETSTRGQAQATVLEENVERIVPVQK
ncbi:YigZ family protein [Thermanaerothrix sp. 4228-RoL]|uniref:YigZ family protein n=2 Tax=Thermanaerothrix TaxID=1077886 RepID=A0ABU3NNZ6_9CHLR|nr:YigZ family protein [Thermanaerothrix sp. 4228-RoL]MDT8897516.1 YigZ family protein [Thermanaerothrix sp. 4228-RoL]